MEEIACTMFVAFIDSSVWVLVQVSMVALFVEIVNADGDSVEHGV
jgi:hypothetical protein